MAASETQMADVLCEATVLLEDLAQGIRDDFRSIEVAAQEATPPAAPVPAVAAESVLTDDSLSPPADAETADTAAQIEPPEQPVQITERFTHPALNKLDVEVRTAEATADAQVEAQLAAHRQRVESELEQARAKIAAKVKADVRRKRIATATKLAEQVNAILAKLSAAEAPPAV